VNPFSVSNVFVEQKNGIHVKMRPRWNTTSHFRGVWLKKQSEFPCVYSWMSRIFTD